VRDDIKPKAKDKNGDKEKEREVTYIAYGENLESTIKLISCSKAINLVDNEKDVRTKRMFISSQVDKPS
jgi:hypothetical protein